MITGSIILVLFMLAIFFINRLRNFKDNISILPRNNEGDHFVIKNSLAEMNEVAAKEELWWKLLDTPDQLSLALLLTQKALPVWEKYSQANQAVYRNSSSGPFIKIASQLLQTSIEEMMAGSLIYFPNKDNKKIKQCYDDFIGPLIAMQDGNWHATYPVKKVFLAVYNILKGILDQDNISALKNLLALSIGQSLDCLDISKLYSREEIESFLEVYKIKVAS